MPQPNFTFGDATPWPSTGEQGWLGGERVPISGGSANVARPIAHRLNRVPRFAWLLDCGINVNIKHPIPRGISAGAAVPWTTTTAYFNWPSTTDVCQVLFS